MLPDRKRLIYLFHRYLRDTITDREAEELSTYIRELSDEEPLKDQIIQVFKAVSAENDSNMVDWEGMFERITKNKRDKSTAKRIFTWRRTAAAVLILALGALSTYLLMKEDRPKEYVSGTSLKQTDVMPGGNKAVLTLAGGQSIRLSDTGNGKVAAQGNVNILKKGQGLLSYQVNPQTAKEQNKSMLQYNTLTTPRGGQYRLTLSDGTRVWLNAASSIRYPTAFSAEKRIVEISGEAFFEVAKDASKPFIVKKGDLEIKVLGTAFNVNTYDNESALKVTLLEGSVKVAAGDQQSALLKPGQQAMINASSAKGVLKLVAHADIEKVVAWKNGLFVFHNDDLGSIMRKLGRWYDVEVSYEDNNMISSHFTGAIRRQVTLSEVLKMLELAGGARFKIAGRKIIVSK